MQYMHNVVTKHLNDFIVHTKTLESITHETRGASTTFSHSGRRGLVYALYSWIARLLLTAIKIY